MVKKEKKESRYRSLLEFYLEVDIVPWAFDVACTPTRRSDGLGSVVRIVVGVVSSADGCFCCLRIMRVYAPSVMNPLTGDGPIDVSPLATIRSHPSRVC